MKKGYLYIAIATIMFSTFEVVLKYIAADVNSVQLTLTRFSIGFLFLLPLALRTLKKRHKRLTGRTVIFFALLGLLGIAIAMTLLHLSVSYTDASVVAMLFACNPVFVIFLAWLLLKEPVKPRHIAALALEIIGAIAIIDPFQARLNLLGVGLALLSTLLFALYSVLGKRTCLNYGGAVVTCGSFFFGSLIVLAFILVTRIPAVAGAFTAAGLPQFANIPIIAGYDLHNLPFVLYVSAGVAGLGFLTYFQALECQPASVVSLVYFFKPAIAPVLAWWLHSESIPPSMLAGILLIVAGSMCAIIPGVVETHRVQRQAATPA